MFNGRIVDAYNVFTQNNTLSIGQGHGTHTAGLAVGSADYYNKGASGVAPNCKLMPIQVFDNGKCPLSAMVAGVMYALHHDADVVNISIAPSFKGLNVLPVTQQDQIARTQFHNVAALWARVSKLAAKKRVFSYLLPEMMIFLRVFHQKIEMNLLLWLLLSIRDYIQRYLLIMAHVLTYPHQERESTVLTLQALSNHVMVPVCQHL